MADQDGLHSETILQLLRHVTSLPYDADVNFDFVSYEDPYTGGRPIYQPEFTEFINP